MYPIAEISDKHALHARLSRHYLGLVVSVKMADGTVQRSSFSGFAVHVEGQWSFVTAGHALHNLRAAVDAGAKEIRWNLVDTFASSHAKGGVLPVDFRLEDWVIAFDAARAQGMDLAAIPINQFHVRALVDSGVVPLDLGADYLRLPEHGYNALALLGVPIERVQFDPTRSKVTLGLRLIPATPIGDDQVHPELRSIEDRIYGVVNLRDNQAVDITTVEGTSGGALFGIWVTENGTQYDYTAVGVQSGWHASSQQIAAWPLDRLAYSLAVRASSEGETGAQ